MGNTNTMELRKYIKNGFNILIQGKHGTGKTTMLLEACEAENLKLKLFNAASLDPYTDLVGVPKFVQNENGEDVLKSIRPHDVDDADVIFIDEINRAGDPKTTNAVLELIQFHSINGEKLPHLKCIVAAQNPPDDESYDVQPLDPAMVDRFHITIDLSPSVDVSYLTKVFENEKFARALATWYNDHNSKYDSYISPRRMEMLGQVFIQTHSRRDLNAAMPPEGKFDSNKLFELLSEAVLTDEEIARAKAQREKSMNTLVGVRKKTVSINSYDEAVKLLDKSNTSFAEVRKLISPALMTEILKKDIAYSAVLRSRRNKIIGAISSRISPENLLTTYLDVFNALSMRECLNIWNNWSVSKQNNVNKVIGNLRYQKHVIFNKGQNHLIDIAYFKVRR